MGRGEGKDIIGVTPSSFSTEIRPRRLASNDQCPYWPQLVGPLIRLSASSVRVELVGSPRSSLVPPRLDGRGRTEILAASAATGSADRGSSSRFFPGSYDGSAKSLSSVATVDVDAGQKRVWISRPEAGAGPGARARPSASQVCCRSWCISVSINEQDGYSQVSTIYGMVQYAHSPLIKQHHNFEV